MSAEALANFLESENIEYRQNEPMRLSRRAYFSR